MLNGKPFGQSDEGQALVRAKPDAARPIYELAPSALVFGAWNSTGQGGGLGAKFPRAVVSEIIGIGVATDGRGEPSGQRTGSRIDPLGIRSGVKVVKLAGGDWQIASGKEKGVNPSEINHSNIAPSVTPLGVSVDFVQHTFVLSLPALRRLHFLDRPGVASKADRAAHAALAALALAACLEMAAALDAAGQLLITTARHQAGELVAGLQAYGYRAQSTSYTAQSQLDTAQSQQALLAGEIAPAAICCPGCRASARIGRGFRSRRRPPERLTTVAAAIPDGPPTLRRRARCPGRADATVRLSGNPTDTGVVRWCAGGRAGKGGRTGRAERRPAQRAGDREAGPIQRSRFGRRHQHLQGQGPRLPERRTRRPAAPRLAEPARCRCPTRGQEYQDDLDQLRQQISGGLNTAQQIMFNRNASRLINEVGFQAAAHLDQQQKTYTEGVNQATADNAARAIATTPADDTTFFNNVDELRRAAVKNAQLHFGDGADPKILGDAASRATDSAVAARVEASRHATQPPR